MRYDKAISAVRQATTDRLPQGVPVCTRDEGQDSWLAERVLVLYSSLALSTSLWPLATPAAYPRTQVLLKPTLGAAAMPACSAGEKEADGMEAKNADEMSLVHAMTPGVLVAGSLQGASWPRAAALRLPGVPPVSEGGGEPSPASPVPLAPPRTGTGTATRPTGSQDEQCMLPFALRLNLSRDSLTGIMNWVSLVSEDSRGREGDRRGGWQREGARARGYLPASGPFTMCPAGLCQ